MNKIRVFGVLVVVAAGATAGCGFSFDPGVEPSLLGTWEWLEASGGLAGVTNTPASTGMTMTLVFEPDGTARLRSSAAPERVAGYETVRGAELDGGDFEIRYDAPLFGFETQTALLSSSDELVLLDACCDGFTWRFRRVP